MHFHFGFTALQILWTLTFAALLVLLVVLLGRDRMRRFPWFSTSIALMAFRLMVSRLLYGRIAQIPMAAIFLTLNDLSVLVDLLVLVEVSRRAFAAAKRRSWIVGTLALAAVAMTVIVVWGPWPAWKTLIAGSSLAGLRLMQLLAQKGELLVEVLAVGVGLLVVFFGARFKAGWRTHTQRIAIGLSTAAMAQLVVQGAMELIAIHTILHSRAEYDRLMDLRERFYNASSAIYIGVLVWWIACLWRDEPGAPEAAVPEATAASSPGDEPDADSTARS